MKKFLKFLLLLLIVAAISFGISIWWSKRQAGENPELLSRFDGNPVEYYQAGPRLQKLTAEEAYFPFLDETRQEVRYYQARTGDIKSVKLQQASPVQKIATIKPRATGLAWSRTGEELLAQYGSGGMYYHLGTGASKPLDAKIFNPVFSTTSDEVAYLYYDQKTSDGNISVADSKLENFKEVLKTRLKEWEILWNRDRRLSLIASPAPGKRKSLFILEQDTKKLTKLINSQDNLQIAWSPDGKQLLYSRGSTKPELFAMEIVSAQTRKLNLKTMASKCAWKSDSITLYCAVPESSDDAFYSFNVTKSDPPLLLASAADSNFSDAREMLYINALPGLVFKNFKDGRLYMLSIAR